MANDDNSIVAIYKTLKTDTLVLIAHSMPEEAIRARENPNRTQPETLELRL
jgi:hypothetical protein